MELAGVHTPSKSNLLCVWHGTHAGAELFDANNQYNLAAILSEGHEGQEGDAAYYSTALVKKERCENGNWRLTADSLQVGCLDNL